MGKPCPYCGYQVNPGAAYHPHCLAMVMACRQIGIGCGLSSRTGLRMGYGYIFRWDRCGRKGQLCKVTARGSLNSCRVEFPDGFVMITSRNALRKST